MGSAGVTLLYATSGWSQFMRINEDYLEWVRQKSNRNRHSDSAKGGTLPSLPHHKRLVSKLPESFPSRKDCTLWRQHGIVLCLTVSSFSYTPHTWFTQRHKKHSGPCFLNVVFHHPRAKLHFSLLLSLWHLQCLSFLPAEHSVLSDGSLLTEAC